jgi:putative membrane protein
VAVFCAGAFTGLALFVKLLQWLLTERRRATLAVMTGLMIGSLRALWPWQDDDRGLLGPSGDVVPVAGFALLGIALVAALLVVEARALAGAVRSRVTWTCRRPRTSAAAPEQPPARR